MRKYFLLSLLGLAFSSAKAQLFSKPVFSGMYLQWGYNKDFFSRSDIHFSNGGEYDFTIHDAESHDRPDFQAIYENTGNVTIPQNSYRIGVYLNKERTHAIEFNFDHAKYVMDDYKVKHITGTIHGERIDGDTMMVPEFVHFEHTNGANFFHLNYVRQRQLFRVNKSISGSTIWKLGAGVVVPKSDVTIMGKRLDNRFHVAGYIVSAEAGFRLYPLKNFFFEFTGKAGFANYLNVLTVEGGKASHKFYYGEVLALVGYDIGFNKKQKNTK
jgi:hypothetical protein